MEIAKWAFLNCDELTSVEIGERAFGCCAGLASIEVAKENKVFDSRDNCNAIIETKTNKLICGCKTTVIPNSVTVIGEHAFWGCLGLKSVVIPKSVKSIGERAFGFCCDFNEEICCWAGLESVIIEADLEEIDKLAFDNHVKYLTLKGSIDNVRESIVDCISCLNDLETNYVPYGKVGYYKSKLPGKYHKLLKMIPKEEKKK